jgi:hypothetical protein
MSIMLLWRCQLLGSWDVSVLSCANHGSAGRRWLHWRCGQLAILLLDGLLCSQAAEAALWHAIEPRPERRESAAF